MVSSQSETFQFFRPRRARLTRLSS